MQPITLDKPLTHRQVLLVFSGLMLGMLLGALDHTILATALPTIVGELGGLDHLSWVVTSYMLATTVSTPLYGKLGDLYGRKRLFQAAIVVFLAGSVLCGLAQTMGQLIAFRAVQGLGAGGLMVLAQAIVADVVAPRERGRYQGYFVAVFGVSSVVGPLLGGFLTDQASWRWVFYVNVPVGVVALLVTSVVLPANGPRRPARLDVRGAALLSGGVTALVLLTTWGGTEYEWGSPVIVALGVASAVLLTAFVAAERRAEEPLLPLRLFRNRTFTVASGVSLFVGFAMFGTLSFLPMFLQLVTNASATHSGLLLLPMMGGLLLASTVSGQIVSRTGRYKAIPMAGTLIATVGMVLLSTMGADTPRFVSAAYMATLGIGMGLVMQVLIVATQNAVSHRDLGVGTSSVNFFRSIGGSMGVAVFGALFAARFAHALPTNPLEGHLSIDAVNALAPAVRTQVVVAVDNALSMVFLVAAPLLALAFVLTTLVREIPLRSAVAKVDHEREVSAALPVPEMSTH
ncbi:MAG TPA: MDR family MFS transporter [Acidimicrobiales bacterium]|nr:MDR family MFS transporter [Acidimicrobiales bacterium]